MKLFAIAAGLVALSGSLSMSADAQHRVVRERTVVTRPAPDRDRHARTSCTWQYRHHHKVRVCRTVGHR